VPADADFIIEGYVDPGEEMIWEGPFGDHTGYYSLPDWYPKFHITCITHRKNAVYPSTIVGIPPQEDAWIGKATERIFLAPIKMTMVPEIVDMDMPVEGVFHNLVIVKIKKEYAGQAQKVMNAMWGAGQMMFNKILVIADEQANIHDYRSLTRYVFRNLNPATDIYFSQGPMDVLDHSCSRMGFGGKMCMDGTTKFEEELVNGDPLTVVPSTLNAANLKVNFPEIKAINASLLSLDIPCIFIAVEKNRRNHIRELNDQLFALKDFELIKMILYVEHTVDVNDIPDALWRFCNNLDPKRDSYLIAHDPRLTARNPPKESSRTQPVTHIGLDGTRKTKEWDDFQRDWPNIIVADDSTIQAIDQKWAKMEIGPMISSPSLKYKSQLYGEEASVQ